MVIGCHRKIQCAYLHRKIHKTKIENQEESEPKEETSKKSEHIFNCDKCDFKCEHEVTLKKHMNTKHIVQNPRQKAVTKQRIII